MAITKNGRDAELMLMSEQLVFVWPEFVPCQVALSVQTLTCFSRLKLHFFLSNIIPDLGRQSFST
jgi:hypothetical protein